MNTRTPRHAWALLFLVSLGLASPAIADTGVPPHNSVGTELGACVAQVVRLSGRGSVAAHDLEKGIMSQCQSETIAWNQWCRPLFQKRHSVDYAVAQCDREWALTVATIVDALKQTGALHLKDGK